MMKNKLYIILVLLLLAFINCKQIDTKNNKKGGESTTQAKRVELENAEYSIEDRGDELQDFGIIESIGDGNYPFFVVTVNFVKHEMKIDFNLNIESISLDIAELNELVGEYAAIHYTSELENSLIDLQIEGKSLFGEYAPKYDSNWHQIKGVLNGADAITPGDLPSIISVTDREGEKMNFELFINSETVKANNKPVDAFYDIRIVNTITQIFHNNEN
jgi:hypothetical protein